MNLDLTKLSKKELNNKIGVCSDILSFLTNERQKSIAIYDKILNRRWINPTKLVTARERLDNLNNQLSMNDDFSKVLLDEHNRRCNIEKDKKPNK